MVSGGFDPLHVGHVRLIQDAAKHGDVTVALNSNEWLTRKKGYYVMTWAERAEICYSIKGVTKVVMADDHTHDNCVHALKACKPDIFANGGDRVKENIPEHAHCLGHGIQMLFNIGGDKANSSSHLVWQERPWGRWRMLSQGDDYWVKMIEINPHSKSSLQTHDHRSEMWTNLDTMITTFIAPKEQHRLVNDSGKTIRLIEVATGKPD